MLKTSPSQVKDRAGNDILPLEIIVGAWEPKMVGHGSSRSGSKHQKIDLDMKGRGTHSPTILYGEDEITSHIMYPWIILGHYRRLYTIFDICPCHVSLCLHMHVVTHGSTIPISPYFPLSKSMGPLQRRMIYPRISKVSFVKIGCG